MYSPTLTNQYPSSSSSIPIGRNPDTTDLTVKRALQNRFREYQSALDHSSSIVADTTARTDDRERSSMLSYHVGEALQPPHREEGNNSRMTSRLSYTEEIRDSVGGVNPAAGQDHSSKLQHLLQLRAAHILNRDPSLPIALSTVNQDYHNSRLSVNSRRRVTEAGAGGTSSIDTSTRYSDPMASSIEKHYHLHRPEDTTLPTAVLSSNASSSRHLRGREEGQADGLDDPSSGSYVNQYANHARPTEYASPARRKDGLKEDQPVHEQQRRTAPPPQRQFSQYRSDEEDERNLDPYELSHRINDNNRAERELVTRNDVDPSPPHHRVRITPHAVGGMAEREGGYHHKTAADTSEEGRITPSDHGLFPNDHQIALELRTAHTLLRRYRQDNDRLRSQLAASDSRQTWLTKRLEEVIINSSRRPPPPSDAVEEDGSPVADGGATTSHSLREAHARIQELEDQVSELQGRVVAYEEALRRPGVSPSERDADTLHQTLSRCWSLTSYFVKVFNAVSHVRSCAHPAESDIGGQECGTGGRHHPSQRTDKVGKEYCEYPRALCATQCLRAALRGGIGTEDALREERTRCYAIPATSISFSVLEELVYCEERCVKLAGEMLQSYATQVDEGPPGQGETLGETKIARQEHETERTSCATRKDDATHDNDETSDQPYKKYSSSASGKWKAKTGQGPEKGFNDNDENQTGVSMPTKGKSKTVNASDSSAKIASIPFSASDMPVAAVMQDGKSSASRSSAVRPMKKSNSSVQPLREVNGSIRNEKERVNQDDCAVQ